MYVCLGCQNVMKNEIKSPENFQDFRLSFGAKMIANIDNIIVPPFWSNLNFCKF